MPPLSHTLGQNDSPNPLKISVVHRLFTPLLWQQSFGFIRYVTLFDLYIIIFATGIMVYFAVPFELPLWIALAFCAGFAALHGIARYKNLPLKVRKILILIVLFGLGSASAAHHTQSQPTAFLPDYDKGYNVTGWVEGQDKSRTGARWMIRVTSLEGVETPPKRLRIRGKGDGIKVGDAISVRAVMKGPLYPATPDGYDARRAAYFQGLGGSGYAVAPLELLNDTPQSTPESFERRVLRFRYALAQRIEAQSPTRTAGLQAALITGLRQGISDAHVSALRASGLAHILAISGLHMAIFAGSFYSLMAFGLASIPSLARGRDVRKYAAFAGIMAASLYLLISGASVATQRAYIMAVILFLAVILDRQALSTRSVSIAALITLLLHPESLLSVGFQMSFAAVLALVVVYRHWSDWKAEQGWVFINSRLMRLRNGFISLSVTSFVAGLATGLFAIMQFQRWAKYGLLGNLAAMPMFTFLVMPMALVTFLLLPFGLERFPLWIMGQGLEQVFWVASHIEALPNAMLAIKKPPAGYVGLYAICFLMLCLGRIGLKAVGGGVGCVLAVFWVVNPVPVLRVSAKGHVTWQSDDGVYFTLNRRADRFGRDQFLRQNGNPNAAIETAKRLDDCDAQGCFLKIRGRHIAIVETPDLLGDACEQAELVILQKRDAGPRSKYLCSAQIIDPKSLGKSGALDIYIRPSEWMLKQAKARKGSSNTYVKEKNDPFLHLFQRPRPWN